MMFRTTTISIALLCAAASGCSSLAGISSVLNPFGDPIVTTTAANPAVEVACIWQPGEGRGEKGVPARGFSGQVYFFTNKGSAPVLVNGTMRIYLFADVGTPEERTRPLKQFDYEPAAWSAHAAMGSLGPCYSVFVPYPRVEAYQVRCQLRARFTPDHGGPPIWSEAVNMVLDGPPQPGAAPAWWTNIEPGPAAPMGRLDISHQRGTLEQLRQKETSAKERTLRTDTFSLDAVRPASYEFPSIPNGAQQESQPVPRASSPRITATNHGRYEPNRATEPRQTESAALGNHLLQTLDPSKADRAHPFAETSTQLLAEHPWGDAESTEHDVSPGPIDTNRATSDFGAHPLAL